MLLIVFLEQKMKRLHIKTIKWLANKFGYEIAMIKFDKKGVNIEGNPSLIKYVDVFGYSKDKKIVRRYKIY